MVPSGDASPGHQVERDADVAVVFVSYPACEGQNTEFREHVGVGDFVGDAGDGDAPATGPVGLDIVDLEGHDGVVGRFREPRVSLGLDDELPVEELIVDRQDDGQCVNGHADTAKNLGDQEVSACVAVEYLEVVAVSFHNY